MATVLPRLPQLLAWGMGVILAAAALSEGLAQTIRGTPLRSFSQRPTAPPADFGPVPVDFDAPSVLDELPPAFEIDLPSGRGPGWGQSGAGHEADRAKPWVEWEDWEDSPRSAATRGGQTHDMPGWRPTGDGRDRGQNGEWVDDWTGWGQTGWGQTSRVGGLEGRSGIRGMFNQPEGQLHDAYSRSYRSQMPDLKRSRRDDREYDPQFESAETDLFGAPQSPDSRGRGQAGTRGQWSSRYEALIAWPYYSNGHTGLVLDSAGGATAEPFEHQAIVGNRAVLGWESAKGPGGVIQYTDLFSISERLSAASAGATTTVGGQVVAPGFPGSFGIVAGPGERLEGSAREHLTSIRPTVFKRVYFPISTITGGFGFDYTLLRQAASYAHFSDLGTTVPSETLDGRRRFSGIGPSFDIEYHRPIGHTSLAILGGAQLGTIFGSDRWEVLRDGQRLFANHTRRTVTQGAVRIGIEWSQAVGSKPDSRLFARFTIEGQNWLEMGSFSAPSAGLGFLSGNLALGAHF